MRARRPRILLRMRDMAGRRAVRVAWLVALVGIAIHVPFPVCIPVFVVWLFVGWYTRPAAPSAANARAFPLRQARQRPPRLALRSRDSSGALTAELYRRYANSVYPVTTQFRTAGCCGLRLFEANYEGTAWVHTADRYLVTAGHNVLAEDGETLTSCIYVGVYPARVVRVHGTLDVAVLHVDDADFLAGVAQPSGMRMQDAVPVPWCSTPFQTGENAVVIGNTLGSDSRSVAAGNIRNATEFDASGQVVHTSSTVAALAYAGNSGSFQLKHDGSAGALFTFGREDAPGMGGGATARVLSAWTQRVIDQDRKRVKTTATRELAAHWSRHMQTRPVVVDRVPDDVIDKVRGFGIYCVPLTEPLYNLLTRLLRRRGRFLSARSVVRTTHQYLKAVRAGILTTTTTATTSATAARSSANAAANASGFPYQGGAVVVAISDSRQSQLQPGDIVMRVGHLAIGPAAGQVSPASALILLNAARNDSSSSSSAFASSSVVPCDVLRRVKATTDNDGGQSNPMNWVRLHVDADVFDLDPEDAAPLKGVS